MYFMPADRHSLRHLGLSESTSKYKYKISFAFIIAKRFTGSCRILIRGINRVGDLLILL